VKAWAKLQKSYPHTSIDLLTLRSSDVVKSVLSRKADIGVCFSPQPHPELESLQIYQGELYLNTRKGHPLQKNKSKLDFSELSNYPAVLPKAFEGIDICMRHPMFKKFKIKPQPQCLFDSYNISQELLLNSDYWALTTDLFIDKKTCSILVPQTGWKAPYSVSIIWRKHQYTPKFFNEFQGILTSLFPAPFR
jgi:DNA-binding transcriptional LysR family regulator